jgi:hypothetical protein
MMVGGSSSGMVDEPGEEDYFKLAAPEREVG